MAKKKLLNIDNLEESQNIKACVICRVFVYVRDCLMFKFATKPPYSTHSITARTGVRVDKNVACLSSLLFFVSQLSLITLAAFA